MTEKVVTPVKTGVQFLLNWLKRQDSGCSLSCTGCGTGMTKKGDFPLGLSGDAV